MNLRTILKDAVRISFSGRINRTVYWIGSIFWTGLLAGLLFIISRTINDGDQIQKGMAGALVFAFCALFGIANISLFARRLHDRNMSGLLQLVSLIPIGGVWLLAECGIRAGTRGENEFGMPYGVPVELSSKSGAVDQEQEA